MYLVPAPNVKKGLEQIGIGNQMYDLPKAFMDRLMYDAGVAYQNQGMKPTRQDVIGMYYKPAPQGMYSAYAGLDSFLKPMQQKYSGSGYMNNYQTATQDSYSRYRDQQHAISQGKSPFKQTTNLQGQVTSSVAPIGQQQVLNDQTRAQKFEKKQRADLMDDLQKFKNIGQGTTISNMPVKVTSPKFI